MRALRASKSYAAAHIGDNMLLWIGISAAGAVLTAPLMYYFERGTSYSAGKSHWGDAMTLFLLVCGTLVMIRSQEGYVSPYAPPTEEDDEAAIPVPGTSPTTAV
jgi:hypothetical protein